MNNKLLSALLAAALATSTANAFDEHRKGFLVGIGAGATINKTKATEADFSIKETNAGFATSFKIGYGFTNEFLLYYVNDVSWHSYKNSDDTYISALTGIGVSFYFDKKKPFYVMGAIGVGTYGNLSLETYKRGAAYSLGLGYEIIPHLNVETSYMATNVKIENAKIKTDNLRATLNYTWY